MAATPNSVFQSLDNGNSPLELLMLGCTANEANDCANTLRNNGQAVHIKSASNRSSLAQLLETEPCDLVIINTESKQLPLQHGIDAVREANPAVAIILMDSDPGSHLTFAAEQDIRDIVKKSDNQHLAFAVQREHHTLLLRQELSRVRHKLNETERRCDSLLGKSRDAIAYVHEGMHIRANAVYCSMFGIDEINDVEGLPIMDLIAPGARQDFKKILRNLEKHDSFETQVECLGNDGSQFSTIMEFSPTYVDEEPCTQILIADQSQHIELQERIDELTNHDPHTHLFNRNAFMERLEGVLNLESMPSHMGLVQISVNNFAELREHAGIKQADKLLHTVANTLKECAENAHTLARLGDHDFIILITESSSLTEIGERCLSILKNKDFVSATGVLDAPLFSVGVTNYPENNHISAHEILNRSCKATKQAVLETGHSIHIFNEAISLDTIEQPSLDPSVIDLIDHALENDGFRLMYQPIVSLQGDTRENYSVLLRLLDQNDEEHSPGEFWSHAEKTNRLVEIDRWVIRNAIRELVKHRHEGKKINFYVMISKQGITDESMLLWICDCLREFKAKGAWLTFQFSVLDLRSNVQAARGLIDGLKKINCRIAISNFASGPNSETLLKHLPIDVVKLSPEFMHHLANDEEQQNQLSEINTQLQASGIKTIASGVEDANSLAMLWNIGVNYIQGFFLQEPSSTINSDEK